MGYTVNGKEYNYDSSVNQRIKSDFVNREVYSCVSMMVEYILSKDDREAPFTRDDIEKEEVKVCDECGWPGQIEEVYLEEIQIAQNEDGEFICPNCEIGYDTEEEARECCEGESLYKCRQCGKAYGESAYDDLEAEDDEIYEWWLVSGHLLSKLKGHGEYVIESEDLWGRCCCGQSIMLDNVISEICCEMEILEGQKYSWAPNEVA